MPHLHLHLVERGRALLDEEGAQFSTIDAAVAKARATAREIMAYDIMERGVLNLDGYVEIVEPANGRVERVQFEEAISIRALAA